MREHHRPISPGAGFFEDLGGGADPAQVREAGDLAATVLVRGARGSDDAQLADRVLHLAETEGLETLADVWSGAPADSLAGCLWRLYLLRAWVHAAPTRVAREYEAGRAAQVARVVAGVADPPGPDQLRAMVDEVLRGITGSDFADVLLRAAAFARVVATGRAALPTTSETSHGSTYESAHESTHEETARMLTLAEQLEAAGHLELRGALA